MFPCEAFSFLNCCLSADCQAESITQEHKPPQHTDALFQSLNVQQNEFGLVLSLSTSNHFRKASVCHQYRAFLISKSAGILNISEHALLHFLCSIFLQCICLYKNM